MDITQIKDLSELKPDQIKKGGMAFRAYSHKLRQQLLALIEDEKKITVTELYVRLRIEQSVCSQHLGILRKAGLVTTERDGKFIFYSVNYRALSAVAACAKTLLEFTQK